MEISEHLKGILDTIPTRWLLISAGPDRRWDLTGIPQEALSKGDELRRYISNSIQVDLHIVVDGSMTVREGHAIADDVRDCLIEEIPDVVDVVVHVDPPESTRNAHATNKIGD